MGVLTSSQLKAVRELVESNSAVPAQLVKDLLTTLEEQRRLKKRWQRLATKRGQALTEIVPLHNRIATIIQGSLPKEVDHVQ